VRPPGPKLARLAALGGALLLDRAGEPPERAHPVVWMGRALALLEEHAPSGAWARLLYGAAGVALLAGGAAGTAGLASWLAAGRWTGVLVEAWLLKTCLSYHGLEAAGARVAGRLEAGDLEGARKALRALVSRDRASLDASLAAAAAVESLAENLSDSFVAPVLAYALFGLPGAAGYRAANTADAMLGYRTDRYEYLGKFAARLDDALSFVPARFTALFLVAAAGRSAPGAYAALRRDRGAPASPNAGWPMSAAAGALGVALEKPGGYRLNPAGRSPGAADVRRAILLVRRAAVLGAGLAAVLLGREGA
jgi:adenosylcobinamide-phosphate synthase